MAKSKPDYSKEPAVRNLQEYIRIRTVHPNINYDECVGFLRMKALELDLECRVFEVSPQKPVLVMTWEGLQPKEPAILLNSHMDVVPVIEETWTFPPFAGMWANDRIYGRGAQDMKSVAIIYMESIRRLKSQGVRLKRTVHLSFVPDEEVGGALGMGKFVQTEEYRNLNVGFVFGKGMPSATDEYLVYNGERSTWHMKVVCEGKSGHGSLLLPNNCGEEMRYIIDKFMDLRKESQRQLAENPALTIGDVTSVNLTMLSGGVHENVIPEKLSATFDIRLALSENQEQFENKIQQWCDEAGKRVSYDFTLQDKYVVPTKVDDSNPFWIALKTALEELSIPYRVLTFPGGTDSRYVRDVGTPALGLTPLRRVQPELHERNEGVPVAALMEAVQHYTSILTKVANV